MLATLLLSQGVPMLLSGDECRRTQRGNNNAYCQDNAISWFDWKLVRETNADLLRFMPGADRISAAAQPTVRRTDFLQRRARSARFAARRELVLSSGAIRSTGRTAATA